MTMINTNVGALLARTYATRAAERMQTSMERLSSGKRINSAADDAAGMAVANKMQSQLNGIKMAIRNSQDGISLVQTADGALQEISKLIRRMRELAVQMQNGIYTDQDRTNAQMEVRSLLAEIDKIAANTQYNDVVLLDGTYDKTIRAGNTNNETIRLAVDNVATSSTASIEAYALETAYRTDGGDTSGTQANPLELSIREATTVKIDTSVFSDTFQDFFKADSLGEFSIATPDGGDNADDDNAAFSIDSTTGVVTGKYQLNFEGTNQASDGGVEVGDAIGRSVADNKIFKFEVTYTNRDDVDHVETIEMTLLDQNGTGVGDEVGTQLDDITVETSADASRAIETLDKALEEISTSQAKLGAIENRLSHNIDNLSKGSMLTEQSVGRIMDADFAVETAELSKQQILGQAATSMLAQANMSKQGVIALLK